MQFGAHEIEKNGGKGALGGQVRANLSLPSSNCPRATTKFPKSATLVLALRSGVSNPNLAVVTSNKTTQFSALSLVQQMKSTFGLAAFAVLCTCLAIPASATSNRKASGNAEWVNPYSQQPAHLSFNAIATSGTGPAAKGAAVYTDPNVTYTMDVQFMRVSGNTAWFAGRVTSATPADGYLACCKVGDWLFYKVRDIGKPGVNSDLIWSEDLTQDSQREMFPAPSSDSVRNLVRSGVATPDVGQYTRTGIPITGGNIQVD